MNASLTKTLIGEAGVRLRAEKVGVKDLDQRMRPPGCQFWAEGRTYSDGIWIYGLALLYVYERE